MNLFVDEKLVLKRIFCLLFVNSHIQNNHIIDMGSKIANNPTTPNNRQANNLPRWIEQHIHTSLLSVNQKRPFVTRPNSISIHHCSWNTNQYVLLLIA